MLRHDETIMKRILNRLLEVPHWVHALWGMIIPIVGAYIFFTAPDINWKINAITAALFAPFAAFTVILCRSYFKNKAARQVARDQASDLRPIDPIQQARKSIR